MTSLKLEKGRILIAEPSIIGDISFNRSVLLLVEHTKKNAIGFILNKKLDFYLNDLIPELKVNFKVYNGGPVEQDNLYFIHKVPHLIPDSIEVHEGIYWGGDFKTVCKLINNTQITHNDIRFFLGYSGWEHNQLENELSENSWIVTKNELKKDILKTNFSSEFWKQKMIEFGGNYLLWSNAPEDPSLN